jgi:hypothetical protein
MLGILVREHDSFYVRTAARATGFLHSPNVIPAALATIAVIQTETLPVLLASEPAGEIPSVFCEGPASEPAGEILEGIRAITA